MMVALFWLVIFIYALLAYSALQGYFAVSLTVHSALARRRALRTVIAYGAFLCFAVLFVATTLFFPAWLANALGVMQGDQSTRARLVFLGAALVGATIWIALGSARGQTYRDNVTGRQQ
jgi:hypothetical protein